MCDGVVIEGHMLPQIRKALVSESGSLYQTISWILQNCGVAITRQIETHWRTQCADRDTFFWTWYATQILNRSIRDILPKKMPQHLWKNLRVNHGLPNNPAIRAYLECVNATQQPRYILAEDMDYHDPKAKALPTKTQNSIRQARTGALCSYLHKHLQIRIGASADCSQHFTTGSGPCISKSDTMAACHCLP